ncbi:hypothetical protein N7527_009203 [Penicillium freii]|nr:hypothetical protein N7527_009203 [Penicillium freii]
MLFGDLTVPGSLNILALGLGNQTKSAGGDTSFGKYCTLDSGTESVKISTDSGNNITLSTDGSCNHPYEDTIPSEVTDRCVNAAIRSFLSY